MTGTLNLTLKQEKTLKELVDLAVKMKEAGILGWLKAFTGNAASS